MSSLFGFLTSEIEKTADLDNVVVVRNQKSCIETSRVEEDQEEVKKLYVSNFYDDFFTS